MSICKLAQLVEIKFLHLLIRRIYCSVSIHTKIVSPTFHLPSNFVEMKLVVAAALLMLLPILLLRMLLVFWLIFLLLLLLKLLRIFAVVVVAAAAKYRRPFGFYNGTNTTKLLMNVP